MICPVCKNKSNNVKECDKCKFKFKFFVNKPTTKQQSDYDKSIDNHKKSLERSKNPNPHRISTPKKFSSIKKTPIDNYKKNLERRRNPNPHRVSTTKNIHSIKKTPKESTRKMGKIERNTPVSYSKKEKYETEVEYQRRHLEYGYVKEHEYIIHTFAEVFDKGNNRLILKTDINEAMRKDNQIKVDDYIQADEETAKSIYIKQKYGDIYSKFVLAGGDLKKIYCMIFKNYEYEIFSNQNDILRKKTTAEIIREIDAKEAEEKRKRDAKEAEEKSRQEDERLAREAKRRESNKHIGIFVFKSILIIIAILIIFSILSLLWNSGFFGKVGAVLIFGSIIVTIESRI